MEPPARPKALALLQAARYPQLYVWFIFVSALDLMLTWVVLYFGGREVNLLADFILDRWALTGMVIYKFVLVVVVIFICEIVGHYRIKLGRNLARFAVAITFLPVIVAFIHLLAAIQGHPGFQDIPLGEKEPAAPISMSQEYDSNLDRISPEDLVIPPLVPCLPPTLVGGQRPRTLFFEPASAGPPQRTQPVGKPG